MLPTQTQQGQRRTVRSGSPAHRSTRSRVRISKFDEKRRKATQRADYIQLISYGAIALALFATVVFIISYVSSQNVIKPSTQPPLIINPPPIPDRAKPIVIPDPIQQYIVPNANAVQVTFRLYKNINCDESDDTQYTTVTKASTDVSGDSLGNDCPLCYEFCNKKIHENDVKHMNDRNSVQSVKIISSEISSQLDLYSDCGLNAYHSSVFEFEGCVHLYDWPNTAGIKIKHNSLVFPQKLPLPIPQEKLPPIQQHLIRDGVNAESKSLSTREDIPSYLIVYSCESSEYCAFQAQAAYYGYLTSGQHPIKSGFLRLLTAQEPDDMASYIPTFTAPRNLYSRRYSPYNKADVLVKWFESEPNTPQYDIIVVIDPDNWIIRDITHWIVRAKRGHAVGEAAWFHGSNLVTTLWKEVCLKNCDVELDMVGVPYIVHKDDLAEIAPYFKMYIDIMKEREEKDQAFLNKYKGIQMGWGTEMFAYIFGAAHAGIKHEVVRGIQRRDVSSRPKDKQEELGIDMIHMGRAWWPEEYPLSKKYMHTEGRAWSRFGTQVWCKCNYTASDIIPWPMPEEGVDFQSYHTLYLLYYGREYFGALPKSKYRKPSKRYHEPYP